MEPCDALLNDDHVVETCEREQVTQLRADVTETECAAGALQGEVEPEQAVEHVRVREPEGTQIARDHHPVATHASSDRRDRGNSPEAFAPPAAIPARDR